MSGTLNGALSTPSYLLALLRELSQYPRALTEIIMPKQVRKTNLDMFLVPFQKKGWKIDHHVSNLRTRGFLFQGVQVHPYRLAGVKICPIFFKGGPEPLEKEINEILGSKREDRLSHPFF